MDNNLTFIAAILDRSGSMSGIATQTIDGFNKFVEEQKAAPGEGLLTLVLFDDKYEAPWEALPLKSVPLLTDQIYFVRDSTALNDAVAKTITSVGTKLKSMPEATRPGKVVILIMTDGAENASVEYPRQHGGSAKVAAMIKHQRDKYSWEFIFVGANIDAAATAESYGISAKNAQQYDANPIGAQNVMRVASAGIRSFRGGQSLDVQATSSSMDLEGVGINATTGPSHTTKP